MHPFSMLHDWCLMVLREPLLIISYHETNQNGKMSARVPVTAKGKSLHVHYVGTCSALSTEIIQKRKARRFQDEQ